VTVTDRYDRYYPHQSVISLKYDVDSQKAKCLKMQATYTSFDRERDSAWSVTVPVRHSEHQPR